MFTSANVGFTVEQGKNFTNLNMEMGKSSSGLYAESHWLKNTDDGSQTGGVGAGYNLEVGPVMLNAGAKAIYLGPKKGDNGVAFPVGGGVNVALTDSIQASPGPLPGCTPRPPPPPSPPSRGRRSLCRRRPLP